MGSTRRAHPDRHAQSRHRKALRKAQGIDPLANKVTREIMQEFVGKLELAPEDKQRLIEMTPASYIGNAPAVVDLMD